MDKETLEEVKELADNLTEVYNSDVYGNEKLEILTTI